MKTSVTSSELGSYLSRQLNHLFPDDRTVRKVELRPHLGRALERLELCFSHVRQKYFWDGGPVFDHLHSDHYAMFLYVMGNTVHREGGDERLAAKTFLLNKALHGLDAFYAVNLPEVFLFVHPVGTVLGNARYADYFAVYQNCTIGSDEDGVYPEFGQGTILYARSAVIGRCRIGNNVVVGANSFLLNAQVPDDSVVVGSSPQVRVFPNRVSVAARRFGAPSSQLKSASG